MCLGTAAVGTHNSHSPSAGTMGESAVPLFSDAFTIAANPDWAARSESTLLEIIGIARYAAISKGIISPFSKMQTHGRRVACRIANS